jgi:Rrf2 family transcriptional regulator, iron-sulfur cluster assembly transcription factor
MLSNSCRYGIRAVIYLASRYPEKGNTGIKEISGDLELPTPFLAKILQQLARHRILSSTKGPNGGFSLLKNPEAITLFELIKIIDGEGLFKNCLIHDGTCAEIKRSKKLCPVHKDYADRRAELTKIFKNKTIADLSKTADNSENILI